VRAPPCSPRQGGPFTHSHFIQAGAAPLSVRTADGTLIPVPTKKKPTLGKNGKPLSKAAAKLRLLKRLKCTTKFEKLVAASGARFIAGVDEVGRGALFGPVVAAAVILNPDYRIKGLRDSKLLPADRREVLAQRIREHSIAWSIAAVDVARIDQLNIYWASNLAMKKAVRGLSCPPDHLLIDAMKLDLDCAQTAIIHGDALSASIAAASIIAKVYRDELVRQWAPVFPEYDLASNKGYSAPKHINALREFGPSPLHRQSFAPVWMSSAPQELLEFMLEETADAEAAPEIVED
jgi:ribonuclease HII